MFVLVVVVSTYTSTFALGSHAIIERQEDRRDQLSQHHLETSQENEFTRKIPKADREKYRAIREAKDWANPYLVVRRNDVELISPALHSGRKIVPVTELRDTLLDLPASAWPYGRIVALAEMHLRSAGDDKLIADTKRLTETVLKTIPVEIDPWP